MPTTITGEVCSQFIEYCKLTRNASSHTLRAYESDLRQFSQFLADRPLTDCDTTEIRRYHAILASHQRYKPTTIRRKLATLKSFFGWLKRSKRLSSNPFTEADVSVRLPRNLPRNLTQTQLSALFSSPVFTIPRGVFNERQILTTSEFQLLTNRVALELLFATGVRIGELVKVLVQDVDIATGAILIQGKGARERYVYLTNSKALSLVARYLGIRNHFARNTDALLLNSRGTSLSSQTFRLRLKAAAEQAKEISKHVTPHMLRHSAATSLLEASVDIRFVQRLLGHASISTTQAYTHVSDSSLKQVLLAADPRSRL